ncbi:MAG: DUF3795 domain-containing protein [Deltaproteobacteria bacterium]|nr:DUF3795 domain-containing protein [Deltaproteobacteria bacterium]
MTVNQELLAPCGLYCGVCGVYIATNDENQKFKERLSTVYNLPPDQIKCQGCLSDERFVYCRVCSIRTCALEKKYEGCHQCHDFPCELIDAFPLPVGKKVIFRTIPAWRELGAQKWVEQEEKRYYCPHCGYRLFRGDLFVRLKIKSSKY